MFNDGLYGLAFEFDVFNAVQRWQGFADVFLKTTSGAGNLGLNKNGLNDMKFALSYTHLSFGKINLAYHVFSSIEDYEKAATTDETTKDLGSEFDLEYTVAVPKLANVDFLLKGAFYSGGEAENYSTDVTKFWIGLDYRFTN